MVGISTQILTSISFSTKLVMKLAEFILYFGKENTNLTSNKSRRDLLFLGTRFNRPGWVAQPTILPGRYRLAGAGIDLLSPNQALNGHKIV